MSRSMKIVAFLAGLVAVTARLSLSVGSARSLAESELTLVIYVDQQHNCTSRQSKVDKTGLCDFILEPEKKLKNAVKKVDGWGADMEYILVDCSDDSDRCEADSVFVHPTLILSSGDDMIDMKNSGNWKRDDLVGWLEGNVEPVRLALEQPTETAENFMPWPQETDNEGNGEVESVTIAATEVYECHKGCLECVPDDDYRCQKCRQGWGQLDPFSASCEPCSEGCKDCSNEDLSCYVCYKGYKWLHDDVSDTFLCKREKGAAATEPASAAET